MKVEGPVKQDKTKIVEGFSFKEVIFSCEHQCTQLGTEINRPHINFATSTFPLKGTVPSIALLGQSAWKHASVWQSIF